MKLTAHLLFFALTSALVSGAHHSHADKSSGSMSSREFQKAMEYKQNRSARGYIKRSRLSRRGNTPAEQMQRQILKQQVESGNMKITDARKRIDNTPGAQVRPPPVRPARPANPLVAPPRPAPVGKPLPAGTKTLPFNPADKKKVNSPGGYFKRSHLARRGGKTPAEQMREQILKQQVESGNMKITDARKRIDNTPGTKDRTPARPAPPTHVLTAPPRPPPAMKPLPAGTKPSPFNPADKKKVNSAGGFI